MNSPFPGMDPYLELHWPDVHTSVVSLARDALNRSLPDDLAASAEERIAIEDESGGPRGYVADLRVFEPQSAPISDLAGLAQQLRRLCDSSPSSIRSSNGSSGSSRRAPNASSPSSNSSVRRTRSGLAWRRFAPNVGN
jgi:hypothetical protein